MPYAQFFSSHGWQVATSLLTLAILLVGWLALDLRRRWNAMFPKRVSGRSEALADALERLAQAEVSLRQIEPRLRALEAIGRVAVQKIGFMRFNPFEHTGGDQSFAVVFLDRENNGVIVSSLYTREGVRVYAKKIQG
ncbi:MAG: DUF4446 family protein, partial [Candidatus Sungbacteria bacterium]|nr:DUF4446 family protein [Candidatus Sungbacteria bacterium]